MCQNSLLCLIMSISVYFEGYPPFPIEGLSETNLNSCVLQATDNQPNLTTARARKAMRGMYASNDTIGRATSSLALAPTTGRKKRKCDCGAATTGRGSGAGGRAQWTRPAQAMTSGSSSEKPRIMGSSSSSSSSASPALSVPVLKVVAPERVS